MNYFLVLHVSHVQIISQMKREIPTARLLVLPSTLYRAKAHARRADKFLYDYIDGRIPALPAVTKKTRKS